MALLNDPSERDTPPRIVAFEEAIVRAVPPGAARATREAPPMTLIQFDVETPAAVDGIHVITYQPGTFVDVGPALAASLVAQGKAHLVNPEPEQGAAPDSPPVADAAGVVDVPPVTAKRDELDEVARSLGIDPSTHPNKDSVRAAIAEHLAEPEAEAPAAPAEPAPAAPAEAEAAPAPAEPSEPAQGDTAPPTAS